MNLPLIASIDALLPQTQCGQCGYAGCKPYAAAISTQQALINQCPPGGDVLIHELADLLGLAYLPLNPVHGEHKPKVLAVIDESACIGCTLCIAACPVDAIIGASKLMHSVIAAECTGCELCIAPCHVDCISLLPVMGDLLAANSKDAANLARERHEYRLWRQHQTQQMNAGVQKNHPLDAAVSQPGSGHENSRLDTDRNVSTRADIKKAAMLAAMKKAAVLKSTAALNKANIPDPLIVPAGSLMPNATNKD